MRRTIIPLSLLAAAAICALAVAGSAGAAPRAPGIVCPQPNGQILPCCPLPPQPGVGQTSPDVQPICCNATTPCCTGATMPCCTGATTPCCTPAACCPSGGCCATPCATGSLSIASSPNPSTAGGRVVISGALAGSAGSGAQVVLWGKPAGHSSFQKAAQTTTDTSGRYTFTLARGTVMTDEAWYVSSNGVNSATLQQHVDALVALSSATHAASVAQAVRLQGHVTPSHAGETVLIEQRRGGAWRLVARAKLSRASSYSISHRFSQAGTFRLRAVLRTDTRNDQSVSSSLALTVKR